MKILIILLLAVIVITPSIALAENKIEEQNMVQCEQDGGAWESFPDVCANFCHTARSKTRVMCTKAEMYHCNCGTSKCWDIITRKCVNIAL